MLNKDLVELSELMSGGEAEIIPIMTEENIKDLSVSDMPESLPILPLKGNVFFPGVIIPITAGREKSVKLIKTAYKNKQIIGIVAQKSADIEDPTIADLYKVGTMAKVIKTLNMPDGTTMVILQGMDRFSLEELVQTEPYWEARVIEYPDGAKDLPENYMALAEAVKDMYLRVLKMVPNIPADPSFAIQNIENHYFLLNYVAAHLDVNVSEKQKLLEINDFSKRANKVLSILSKELELQKLKLEIQRKVSSDMDKQQRDYLLTQQLKTIQEELGDKAKKESDIEELRKKIYDCKMPKAIEEKALNELSRYAMLSASSGESSISRTYLDFIISLPWSNKSEDCKDILKAKDQLDKDHYGLDKVKDRILEYLAVCIMTQKTPQAILCLVGPPGVGKTSLAKSIAKAMNKQFIKQSLGGVKDESEIRGHRRTYLGALPGRILQGMKRAGTINPVFLLDEIDKLTSDYRGDPASAMLEVLDAEQNKFFSDNYLEEPYDLSNVFFIATANYLENIPPALRDRLEIVQLSSYTEYEKFEIAKIHLIDKQLEIHGLSKADFTLTDEAIWMLIREYTREAGVRELERYIGTLIRKAIKTILMNKENKIVIDENNLTSWIGKPRFSYTKLDEIDQVGIVTGLAYTQYGGDTLPIEATCYKGDGRLLLTGKLGDVMKESGQAAFSYVKNNCEKLNIDPELFSKNDIHIHVPEGAVPKDGPSAGVALTTAIASLLTHRKVDHTLGMTGEITLRGRVLPIGGLREKSIAAHRSGLKKILIPKENVKDIEDIPETVLKDLQIIPVSTAEEVLEIALLK